MSTVARSETLEFVVVHCAKKPMEVESEEDCLLRRESRGVLWHASASDLHKGEDWEAGDEHRVGRLRLHQGCALTRGTRSDIENLHVHGDDFFVRLDTKLKRQVAMKSKMFGASQHVFFFFFSKIVKIAGLSSCVGFGLPTRSEIERAVFF